MSATLQYRLVENMLRVKIGHGSRGSQQLTTSRLLPPPSA